MDFVNTIHDRYAAVPEDYLSDYSRYLGWSLRVGLVTAREARALAALTPPPSLLREMRSLREKLHRLFGALVDGHAPEAAALAGLEAWLHRAWRGLALDARSPTWLAPKARATNATLPLQRLALSALDILQHCPPARLKRCASEDECGWLFIDETKNNRRRWCAMDTCGVRAKMQTYRRRH